MIESTSYINYRLNISCFIMNDVLDQGGYI